MTQTQDSAIELQEEFFRWDRRKSGDSRHWAIRTDRPTTAQIKAGAKLFVDGDTPAQLAERLRAEELLLAKVGGQ